ncbi:Dynamin, GTPase domain protein [Moelleriella libera RCEF 2490]|uniref:Dynamin, GTPase domain protein n=1 Tax=Moelleriella libera RCEF 2490 TaxID=1081109 RepID=A0A167ZM47_9HYPO|nr:Dynamin, GTPase domain protein [Moelleriella libera RCEF 2490]
MTADQSAPDDVNRPNGSSTPASESQDMFNRLKSVNSTQRLNQIEKVRANGIGDLVALPQLVVCGDQSTGKSSVLERITVIPFPREEGLCTRFPTQINLRHSEASLVTKMTASIRPHSSRGRDTQDVLASYRKEVQDMSHLPSIIQEVSTMMGLRGYSGFADAPAFSSDVLQIDITGPLGLHLSVVDLPGLVTVPNDQQTEEDIEAVHAMVAAYLQSSRTIILTVLQASSEMANQPIIKLAREYDPEGERTVGIITKPDLINRGAQASIACIARNEGAIKLKLGFFLVKNPTPDERDAGADIQTQAKRELGYFTSPPWSDQNLDMDRVGAENLRQYLQTLLDAHIERELPNVRHEAKKVLAAKETELKLIGEERHSVAQIRSFLIGLGSRFYQLLQAASRGSYDSVDPEFFSGQKAPRLRALIQKLNSDFAEEMQARGQRRKIGRVAASSASESDDGEVIAELIVSKDEMNEWVEQVYLRCRGRELPGTFNWALLSELFMEQSSRWSDIAENHLQTVLATVRQWIDAAATRLVAEERLRNEIRVMLRGWLENAEHEAKIELGKLLEDERGSPMTYNHYFTDNVEKARLDIQAKALREVVDRLGEEQKYLKVHLANPGEVSTFLSAVKSRTKVLMNEQACDEGLIQLNAYYKVAMKTFVDNVARQVIERHIMTPFPDAFNPSFVCEMSEENLVRIGSEPRKQAIRRRKLLAETEALRKSLIDLQRVL